MPMLILIGCETLPLNISHFLTMCAPDHAEQFLRQCLSSGSLLAILGWLGYCNMHLIQKYYRVDQQPKHEGITYYPSVGMQ